MGSPARNPASPAALDAAFWHSVPPSPSCACKTLSQRPNFFFLRLPLRHHELPLLNNLVYDRLLPQVHSLVLYKYSWPRFTTNVHSRGLRRLAQRGSFFVFVFTRRIHMLAMTRGISPISRGEFPFFRVRFLW